MILKSDNFKKYLRMNMKGGKDQRSFLKPFCAGSGMVVRPTFSRFE